MSVYSGMYNDWSPLLGEQVDTEDDVEEEVSESENTRHSFRAGNTSRNHDGLCRRGHAGHRR